MANGTFNGSNAAKIASSIPKLAETGQQNGTRRVIYDTYTLTADLASGDRIRMGGLLPAGALITGCEVYTDTLGGSCTLDIGWEASADAAVAQNKTGFFSAMVASSAAVQGLGAATATFATFGKVFASPVQISIWEHAVSSGATGLIISIAISYIET